MLWAVLTYGSQAGVQAVSLVIFARLLTPEDFGVVGAAMMVVGLSQIFSQLGVGPALVQFPDLTRKHIQTAFGTSLTLGFCFAVGIGLSAQLFADFFRMPGLTPVLQVASLLFVVSGLGAVSDALLQRDLAFRVLSLIRFGSYFLGYAVVGIPLAFLGWGVWALIGANLAQRVLRTTASFMAHPHPVLPRIDRGALRDLAAFGSGQTLQEIFNYGATQGDNLVVGRVLGAEALGLYGRAYQLMVTPAVLLGHAINLVVFPVMARVQQDPDRLARALRKAVAGACLLMVPASGVIIVLAPEIVVTVLGSTWSDAIVPFQVLAACIALRVIYTLGDAVARASAAVFRGAWRQGVFAFASVLGALIGANWGLTGVAIGVLVAVALKSVLMMHLSLALVPLPTIDLLAAIRPAVLLGGTVVFTTWFVADQLRMSDSQSWLVLSVGISTAALVGGLLCWTLPTIMMGADARAVLRAFGGLLRRNSGPRS